MLCGACQTLALSLRSLSCTLDGSSTLCAHFRALPLADSDFTMMWAISAAESESVKTRNDDRDLNCSGGVIVFQSEGSGVVNKSFIL